MRKGGLEPPRYCYRQPLKLSATRIGTDPDVIPRAQPDLGKPAERASDGTIGTKWHTVGAADRRQQAHRVPRVQGTVRFLPPDATSYSVRDVVRTLLA